MVQQGDNTPRILIIEDNPTMSRTLALFLIAEGYRVNSVCNGRDGLDTFRTSDVDLLILDLMLPDLDGLSVCHSVREHSATPIIMLTAKTTENEIVEGLEAGANDYVCKPFGTRELLARVRRCLRNTVASQSNHNTFRVGEINLDVKRRSVSVRGKKIRLSRSEFGILALLMANPGRVFTREQIIERALSNSFTGFDRTIDTFVWSIRKKIGEPKGAPRYILSELGIGYRMADHHEE